MTGTMTTSNVDKDIRPSTTNDMVIVMMSLGLVRLEIEFPLAGEGREFGSGSEDLGPELTRNCA